MLATALEAVDLQEMLKGVTMIQTMCEADPSFIGLALVPSEGATAAACRDLL